MPKPQYNVKQTDTGSKNYYKIVSYNQPAPAPQPKVNPLKNWWNSIVNNARQNAYAPVNTWDTVAPNVPTFNTSTQRTPWDIPYWTPPSVKAPLPQPTYSVFDPFGVPAYGVPQMPTAYGSNTRRGGSPPTTTATMPIFNSNRRGDRVYPTSPNTYNTINNITRGLNSPFGKPSTYPKPSQNPIGQYTDTDNRNRVLSWEEIAQLPGYGRPPQEEDAYQEGVWVANPEMPAGGGYGGGYGGYGGGGGGGGSYDYFSRPSSPSYTGYGGNGYASMPQAPNYTGYSSGYYSLPSSGGYGGGGGSGYYSMPQAPNYTGYGRSGYASMPQAPTYRGRGGRNQSIAPATAYYRGINSGGGYGGGYAGGQSQRSAWYGALLQWNI